MSKLAEKEAMATDTKGASGLSAFKEARAARKGGRGEAAAAYQVKVSASFVDGAKSGPVSGGESCEAPSLAAIEAILIELVSLKPEGPAVAAPDATASAKGRNGKGRGKVG